MSIQNINWNYPTSIWFGLNRINEIQKACDELNISNPLIVTDPGILQTDIITKINSSPFKMLCPIRTMNFNQGRIKLLDIIGIGSEVISLVEVLDANEPNLPVPQCSIDRPFMVTLATRDIETTKNFYYNKLSIEKSPEVQSEINIEVIPAEISQ